MSRYRLIPPHQAHSPRNPRSADRPLAAGAGTAACPRAVGRALLAGCALVMTAGAGADSVVYPTGVFPDDAQHVQAAADAGGAVLLKAVNTAGLATAFNFGADERQALQSGFVALTRDVTIVGENLGWAQTTIQGGFAPFVEFVPAKTKIQGIDFESPFDSAITLLSSTGSDISHNTVHHVLPVRVRVPSGRIITFADGIDVFGDSQQAVTGTVRIHDNVIDGLGAIFSNGIQFDSVSADSEITGNVIRNVNSASTEAGSGITVIRSQKPVLIENNDASPGPGHSGNPGIFIDGDHSAVYTVRNNVVTGDDPFGDGIDVAGGDATGTSGTVAAVITGNHITLHHAPNGGGIVLFDLVTGALVERNRIEGAGGFALVITTYGFQTNTASLNRFIDNDIEGYSSSVADVFLDANAQTNQVSGECKTVIDKGVGNSVTCTAP